MFHIYLYIIKYGADNGTRTHEVCLEGRNVTITSYPRINFSVYTD